MLTEVGKFLRKVRIDHDEILRNMATKLDVSASFLSAVENGKKRIPTEWISEIPRIYNFDEKMKEDFEKSIIYTEESFNIDLSNISKEKKELAISFARSLNDFNAEQIAAINKILENNKI